MPMSVSIRKKCLAEETKGDMSEYLFSPLNSVFVLVSEYLPL
jgi:hypothetical protein